MVRVGLAHPILEAVRKLCLASLRCVMPHRSGAFATILTKTIIANARVAQCIQCIRCGRHWLSCNNKVLGVGIGGRRGKRRRNGIMRRRTLESVLLHTQHRGRRRRRRKGGRVGLLLRPTAHPLYKPKTNSRRFPLLGSWFLAHILNLFSTTLHLNIANIVCCSNRRRKCWLQSQALLHHAIQK